MFTCNACGKKILFQRPSKYGFCKSCNQELRHEAVSQLDNIKDIVLHTDCTSNNQLDPQIVFDQIDEGLKAIERLESQRERYPFFKSSTGEFVEQLHKNRENLLTIMEQQKREEEEKRRALEAHEEAERLLKKYGPKENYFFTYLHDDLCKHYFYKAVNVVASELIPNLPAVETLSAGDEVEFLQEPTNEYDPFAVLVLHNQNPIGYLRKGNLQDMVNDWIKEHKTVLGKIHSIDPYEYKITLDIAFYTNFFQKYASLEYFDCKLVRTTKETEWDSRQNNLRLLQKGTPLDISEVYDEESTYILSVDEGSEIGELSKKDAAKFQRLEQDYDLIPVLLEVTENDSGTCGAVVRIFMK